MGLNLQRWTHLDSYHLSPTDQQLSSQGSDLCGSTSLSFPSQMKYYRAFRRSVFGLHSHSCVLKLSLGSDRVCWSHYLRGRDDTSKSGGWPCSSTCLTYEISSRPLNAEMRWSKTTLLRIPLGDAVKVCTPLRVAILVLAFSFWYFEKQSHPILNQKPVRISLAAQPVRVLRPTPCHPRSARLDRLRFATCSLCRRVSCRPYRTLCPAPPRLRPELSIARNLLSQATSG